MSSESGPQGFIPVVQRSHVSVWDNCCQTGDQPGTELETISRPDFAYSVLHSPFCGHSWSVYVCASMWVLWVAELCSAQPCNASWSFEWDTFRMQAILWRGTLPLRELHSWLTGFKCYFVMNTYDLFFLHWQSSFSHLFPWINCISRAKYRTSPKQGTRKTALHKFF